MVTAVPAFADFTRAVWRGLVLPLVTALSLLAGASRAAESLPPLPKLPLDTYAPDIRAPIAKAYQDAQAAPRDSGRNGTLGMVLYASEQYEPAVACFERAQALDTADARWPYYLGRTQSHLSQHDRAVASLEEALRRRPGYLPARLLLAKSLLDAGQADKSRQLYEALVKEHPEAAEAHYGLGRIDAARGEAASAVEHLRRACDLFPGFGAAHFALARAYRDLGEREKAEAELALYQKDTMGWPVVPDPFMTALVALKTGAAARLEKGIQLAEAGRLQEAADEEEAALAADPNLLPAHVNLIRIYGLLGRPEKAEEHYRAAVALDPNLAEAHYDYGVLLVGQGKDAEAAQAFRRALELKPDYAEAHNNLAYLLMTSGKLDEAAGHYRAAIQSKPDFRDAHFNLGRILVNQGKVADAIEQLRQALTPEDDKTPLCTYALGAAYARVGNRDEALKYMQQAREKAAARGQTELLNSIDKDVARLTGATGPP
jgi:tetratricopeptide (TPR) repeat protein